jgi:hypothetical protein
MPTFRKKMLSPYLTPGVEDNMVLLKVGMDLQIHTAPKPETSTTSRHCVRNGLIVSAIAS